KKHGIRAVSASDYAATAQRSSLLITCTAATEPVLGPVQLQRRERAASVGCPLPQPGGSQLVIDLGMPRNVDPAVAQLEGVALLDLETIRLHAPIEELQATDAARAVVREAAEDFLAAGSRSAVTPAVVAMRTHIFGLLEAEIDRARRRGDRSEERRVGKGRRARGQPEGEEKRTE